MGDVYLAERADEEYQQRVAIKLVRAGAFSPQVQSRLRTERQILAKLQHPNIARLLDGGRAPDGTPYLVMEYIEGEPIDAYCDRRRLPLAERIALVRTVCSAVHYAHQNLIVHRDLKPNNILITADGEPKLLDFGIAKLLDTRHSAHTLAVTHIDYRVMTPAHASPEQVRGDAITTASDIYVLGVLLYELLCGRRPFQLVGSRLTDMERIICEQEPLRAERHGRADRAGIARTARRHRRLPLDHRRHGCRSDLRGDLDNIVLMAMRKDPERRYSSAEQLSADLERHLNGQPVLATSDTWVYRTRKFVRAMRSPCRARPLRRRHAGRFRRRSRSSRRGTSRASATSRLPSARAPNRCRRSSSNCSSCPIRREAAATRSRRANCSTSARGGSASASPISRKRARRCWARSAASTAASGCTPIPSPCSKRRCESPHRASMVREHPKVAEALVALGDALCERGRAREAASSG